MRLESIADLMPETRVFSGKEKLIGTDIILEPMQTVAKDLEKWKLSHSLMYKGANSPTCMLNTVSEQQYMCIYIYV